MKPVVGTFAAYWSFATAGCLTNCGGAPARSTMSNRQDIGITSVVIRIDSVRVTERPNRPWDTEPLRAANEDAGCELVGALLGAASGALGPGARVAARAVPLLCRAGGQTKQAQRIAALPDLQVRLSAGDRAGYATDVIRDVDRWSFAEQPFVVPLDAIPADGARLGVFDDDGEEGSELIGMIRLYKAELVAALGAPPVVKSESNASFELVALPYRDSSPTFVSMQASEGTRDSRDPVAVGEIVRVHATGQYKVGTYYDSTIGPAGYPGGGPKAYNFAEEPLRSAAHGSAFILVGERKRYAQLTNPCSAFLSPVGGTLTVGINDADPGNDTGTVAYSIERRAPTSEEWARQRLERGCP